jgi:hypothetical protein
MERLVALPNLSHVFLDRTAVSDAGLRYLESARRLQYISLRFTRVTDDGMKRLKAALPSCLITPDCTVEDPR